MAGDTPGRKVSEIPVLTRDGNLRIPGEYIPEDARKRGLHFVLAGVDYDKKTLDLRPSYGKGADEKSIWRRKAIFSNKDNLSPLLSLKGLLAMLNVAPPAEDSRAVDIKEHKDGTLEVQL